MNRFKMCVALALLVCGVVAIAEQDTSIDLRDVRNPRRLKTWLETNAADAEARLAAGGSVSDTLALINANDGGTAKVTLQADKADDAGDKYGIVATDGSGLDIQSDIGSKGTLATVASVENTGLITSLVGIDAIGAVDFDIGSSDVTDVTIVVENGTVVIDDGTLTASEDLASTDDVLVGDDLAVTGAATIGETLGVTGNTTLSGTLEVTGAATLASTLDVDSITVDAGAGVDNQAAGTLMLGESTATKVEIADSGVETEVQGTLDVHEGLDVNEDVTVDLNASDEEIVITQSSAAGTASTPLVFVNDDRTGATANEPSEASISIDAEGVYGLAINDGALYVEGASTLAGAVGASTTLSVEGATTIGGSVTAISTNNATTNVIVTVDAVIDGEHIKNDTIDDDALDFADITGADLTLTDCGVITGTVVVGSTSIGVPEGAFRVVNTTQLVFVASGVTNVIDADITQ